MIVAAELLDNPELKSTIEILEIPKLKTYSEQEIFEKIILPLVKKYPEISWFADKNVAVTQEAPGQTQKPGWTELLVKSGLLKKEGGKYIELERMLSSVVFFHLFYCMESEEGKESDERRKHLSAAFQKFVSIQKKKEERLSEDSFFKLHAMARSVVQNKQLYDAVILMLVVSDLGKTPQATAKARAFVEKSDHDDFIEKLLSLKKEQICEVIPSFQNVSSETQDLIKHAASAMKIHLGHVLHLEGGQCMFAKFEAAVTAGEVSSEVLNFAFLIQLCDVAASAAHVNNEGSLALDENAYQGYQLVGEALKVIQSGKKAKEALQFYLQRRGELLNIPADSPFNRVLIRLACMMRFYSSQDGAMLLSAAKMLSEQQMILLIEQFSVEENEMGINRWKRNPTYVPAVLVNLLQIQNSEEPKQLKVNRALEGALCVAELLRKYSNTPGNTTSLQPLNFNNLAGVAGKHPQYLTLQNFNPAFVNFEGNNVNMDLKAQAEFLAKSASPMVVTQYLSQVDAAKVAAVSGALKDSNGNSVHFAAAKP